MNTWLDIVSTLAQVAVGAIAAMIASRVRRYLTTRRPAVRIWGLQRGKPTHIVTAQDESNFADEFTVKVYPTEYLAAVEVRSLVSDVLECHRVTLSTSREFGVAHFIHDNIVCIGGPVHNRITKILLDRLQLPFGFEGFTLVSTATGNRYDAVTESDPDRILRDVGVVILADNPFNNETRVAILMGARTFGCAAAAGYITEGNLRAADEKLGGPFPKWAILDVDVVDDFVVRASVLESSTDAKPTP